MIDNNKIATVGLVKSLSDDLREGYDETIYSSAGDAVRGQFNKTLSSAKTHVNDLDLLTQTGIYHSVQNTANVPPGESVNFYVVLVMVDRSNSNRITQIYINILNNNIYVRQRNTQAIWEDWNIISVGNSKYVYRNLYSYDLNDLTETGYYIANPNITVSNAPDDYYSDRIFLLKVFKDINNSNRVYQTIHCNANGNPYRRERTSVGVWTPWILQGDGVVYIQPIDANSWRVYFGKYNTRLYHVVNDSTNSDLWNILSIQHNTNALCSVGTDILGPIREKGQPDFMGGVHGDERINFVILKADGKTVDLSTETYCRELILQFESTLYRPSDKTPVLKRYLTAKISYNNIEVTSVFTVLVDKISIDRCTNGGLIAMSNDYLNSISMNNKFYSSAPIQNSHEASSANVDCYLYWDNGYFRIENLIGHESSDYKGFLYTYESEMPVRNKIYFNTVEVPSGKTFCNGDNIVGKFRYTFE